MNEYAQAGVDYTLLKSFKETLKHTGRRTITFPNKRDVFVCDKVMNSHGGVYSYEGKHRHMWCVTQEGLGNKNWMTDLVRLRNPHRGSRYEIASYDNAMMWANDCAAQGALPVICTDEVIASDSGWFDDMYRTADFARGLYEACKDAGMALVQGESAPYKYLVNPMPPVKSSAILGGSVIGIIAPATRLITGELLGPGDRIIGLGSSGLHANGASLVIRRVMGDPETGLKALPDGFDTKLPSGMTIDDAIHVRTRCYVSFVEKCLEERIQIHAFLPGTGDGVGKLASDARQFTYRVSAWPHVHELFLFMRELGVPLLDCLKTFNWGVGLYVFVHATEVKRVIDAANATGYPATEIGGVEEGGRCTIFEPEGGLVLPPPGE